jgi:nucleotide-binding universal stress UspA family protein
MKKEVVMSKFQNILFVSHGLASQNNSLAQALKLSQLHNAKISGLITCPALPSSMSEYKETYQTSLVNTVNAELSSIDQDLNSFPIDIESNTKPAVSVIQHVLSGHHDLVFKEAEPASDDQKGFKALDMKLLRKCPCPVWISRRHSKKMSEQKVAVAIEPDVENNEEMELAIELLRTARSIADTCNGTLEIISCWDFLMESYLRHHIWIHVDDQILDKQVQAMKGEHQKKLDELIEKSGISGDVKVHHVHGSAEELIPRWVDNEDIDTLVMGTIARSGIQGLVIGNTAENILQSIRCSLVALKPKGFVSPIK